MAEVVVEFYGIPRQRAGCAEVTVQASSVTEALRAVELSCPRLAGLARGGRLAPQFLLSANGRRFIADLSEPLAPGDRLLLLSADAGG